jgi:aryl-alcohol dehydrogenase-like predicted oxidoreductase
MERRSFGTTGLTTSVLGMGCSRLGSFGSTSSPEEAKATIRLAVERGVGYFDTADIYGQGDSERLLGAALGRDRDRVLIATKAGRRFSGRARLAARLKTPIKLAMRLFPGLDGRVKQARAGHLSTDFSADYLTTALDASLKRLGTDRVDVFMLHSPPAEVLADASLFAKLARLKNAGKIRCLGISVETMADVPAAARLPGVEAIQLPVGRPERQALAPLLPELEAQGIAVVGREVFAGSDGAVAEAPSLETLLQEAVALPGLAVALVGMSSRRHLEANLAALA